MQIYIQLNPHTSNGFVPGEEEAGTGEDELETGEEYESEKLAP